LKDNIACGPEDGCPQEAGGTPPVNDKAARTRASVTEQEALAFHAEGRPGKLEINPT